MDKESGGIRVIGVGVEEEVKAKVGTAGEGLRPDAEEDV